MAIDIQVERQGLNSPDDGSRPAISSSDQTMDRQSDYPNPLVDNSPEMQRLREQMREAEKYIPD